MKIGITQKWIIPIFLFIQLIRTKAIYNNAKNNDICKTEKRMDQRKTQYPPFQLIICKVEILVYVICPLYYKISISTY